MNIKKYFQKKITNHCLSTFHVWLKKSWCNDTDFLHLFYRLCNKLNFLSEIQPPLLVKTEPFLGQNRDCVSSFYWILPDGSSTQRKKFSPFLHVMDAKSQLEFPSTAPDAMLLQHLRKKGVQGVWALQILSAILQSPE